jgi:hypothetical protein
VSATPLATALAYASAGRAIFPCAPADKKPLIEEWPNCATCDPTQIEKWWRHWPQALIGCPTGLANGFVVLDVDVKDLGKYGFDTLPDTPMAHTRSGGLHLYFQRPAEGLRNTAGSRGRGIGPGCDWRGDGGYVVLPSSDSGYWWDPHCNFDTTPLAEAPAALLPRDPKRQTSDRPVKPETGLSAYAEAALDSACRRIAGAPNGEQRDTLNAEAFAIGTLAGAGAIPHGFARRALLWAAHQIPSCDPRRPWRSNEIENAIQQAFEDGFARPRGNHHGSA